MGKEIAYQSGKLSTDQLKGLNEHDNRKHTCIHVESDGDEEHAIVIGEYTNLTCM